MVKELYNKLRETGGSLSARLFYTVLFTFILYCFGFKAFAIESIFSLSDYEDLSVNTIGSFLELKVFYGDGSKNKIQKVPSFLAKYVTERKDNSVVLKIPLDQQIVVIISQKQLTFKFGEKNNYSESVFNTKEAPSYPLGSGDVLWVELYGFSDINNEVTVDPQGFITLPILDKVFVSGLTIDQLQDRLKQQFSEYINDPQVNVQLKEYGSRYVNVIGEVGSPSRIPLKRALRLLDAISMAGGFTSKSGDIELQRRDSLGNIQKKKIFKDSLLGADIENDNLFLLDGDVINVLPVSSIYLSGEVSSPQAISYEKGMTLLQAISKAGGFTQWANKDNITILRKIGEKTETIKINAKKIEKGKIEDPILFPNDHIIVKERKIF